jgi:hypothetical protein
MLKKCLLLALSFLLLTVGSVIVGGSLILPQSADAMTFAPTGSMDSFQRTVKSGWGGADTGGWWTLVGSPWSWSVAPGTGKVTVGANGQEHAYLSNYITQDVEIVDKVVLPRCAGTSGVAAGGKANCGAYVLGRYTPDYNPTYYRVGVVQGTSRDNIFLRAQRSDGTSLGNDLDTGIPATDGAVIRLRVDFQGVKPTLIRARAWVDGKTEPSTWLLNTADNNSAEQVAGAVGVQLRNEDSSTSRTFQLNSYQTSGTATPVSAAPNPSSNQKAHWLYVVNDGMVYVYDIDNDHKPVKQFPIPEKGKRGVAVAPRQGLLYISECGTSGCYGRHGSLLAYDLVHDVVAWIANYSFGTDQFAITPDGSTIYMPHGDDATDGTHSILDASNGKPLGTINTGTSGHNTVVSLDGTQAYLNGYTGNNYNYAHVVNTATNQETLNAGPTVNGIRPFTVNGKHTLMFTTATHTCGFQVLSLTTKALLHTVTFSSPCSWEATTAPSHGISLSPDEKRVYVLDAPSDLLRVYDVSKLPGSAPTFITSVPLNSLDGLESPCQTNCEREGWVLNDLSGRYVYVGDTGNVVDTRTLSVVKTLPALRNTRLMVEIDWTNGTTSATSTRFGLGRVTDPPPPITVSTVPLSAKTLPKPGSILARDTFQRPNQAHWGNASDGQTWGGDANTAGIFSIVNARGTVSTGPGSSSAILGPAATNEDIVFTGSLSNYANASNNLGGVLRWTDGNNWYKAYIDGASLIVQKNVNGTSTILGAAPFTATSGTSYTLHFQVIGTTLYASVWQTGTTEPTKPMITVTDTSHSSGFCGLRTLVQAATASYTSFQATAK